MPIINPWFIYLANIANTLMIIGLFMVVSALVIALITWLINLDILCSEEERKEYKKRMKKCFITCVIGLLITTFVPSEKTIYSMIIADFITYENVETAADVIQDSVDYLFDKLDSAEEDK